ncbi:unnamed protein product [Clonostachys rosea]|uniref:Heterokaryon incompatibility domain-containing protein n=1 Tax=Bionectria ochroleuca TaxID=29856 RepID=A0ABY6TWF9_BIOOC|nr:unnamed protein product [Clonostachys rosea]
MDSPYATAPLRTRTAFRLLELSPGCPDDPRIHVTLRNTNLAAAESSFEALSYTWGAETPRKPIHCGKSGREQLEVTLNCYTALLNLRHRREARVLWIDAICINQADMQERNAQVRMMGKIFATASRVVIYLGEHDSDSYDLFQHFAETDVRIKSGQHPRELPEPTLAITTRFAKLFERPWFSRVWVIQELYNARDVLFMCGNDLASYRAFHSCLFGYQTNTRICTYPPPLTIKFIYKPNDFGTCFDEMAFFLVASSTCQSSDPRDRVLALTPLITRKSPRLENLVDYTRSVESIFHSLTCMLLDDLGLVIFKLFTQPHWRKMPTWTLDFSQHIDYEDAASPLYSPNYRNLEAGYMTFGKDFSMSEGEIDDTTCRDRLLTVNGVRYGRIEKLSPSIQLPSCRWQDRETYVQELFASLNSMRFGRTLEGWPASIAQAFQSIREEEIHKLMVGHFGDSFLDYSGRKYNDEIISNIFAMCKSMRIFVTTSYQLGLAPRDAMPGDVVCLVRGAASPWIVREKGNENRTWEMICGDCYLVELRDPPFEEGHLMHEVISKHEILEEFKIK